MARQIHLLIESGPAKGREIAVADEGVRIGRSSRNDVSIDDASLSRFHCRFFFKPEGGLWISDLGSVNGTLVNGAEITELQLRVGDICGLGETNIRVVDTQPVPVGTGASGKGVEAAINLGLGRVGKMTSSTSGPLRRHLVVALSTMVVLAVVAWLPWKQWVAALTESRQPAPVEEGTPALPAFEVNFERVEGGPSNIFRFAMTIAGNRLTVQVDDLATDRHVRREKAVAPELVEEMGRFCERAGFFALQPKYDGVAPGVYESTEITLTAGSRTHTVRVVNQVEPDPLARVRAQLEEFSKNELGLAALAIEPGELVKRAHDAYLLGQKMMDEREVDAGNLARGIRALTEAEWYLETIEPKPAFHADVLARRSDCERELQRRYDNVWFAAERNVKLRDWKEAATQLRLVCDMIPDRSDDRNRNAYRKLVDVERHLATEK